jgi:hypothetical protein
MNNIFTHVIIMLLTNCFRLQELGRDKFLPVMFLNDFYNFKEDYVELNDTTSNQFSLTITFGLFAFKIEICGRAKTIIFISIPYF